MPRCMVCHLNKLQAYVDPIDLPGNSCDLYCGATGGVEGCVSTASSFCLAVQPSLLRTGAALSVTCACVLLYMHVCMYVCMFAYTPN